MKDRVDEAAAPFAAPHRRSRSLLSSRAVFAWTAAARNSAARRAARVLNLLTSAFLRKTFRRARKTWKAYRKRQADFGTYTHWLKDHPGGNFKEFYVDTIKGYLVGEMGPHSTLGPHPIWEKQGDAILNELIGLGLRPSDIVVDYGCGTLREGIHLIRYLDADRYIGLDIDERVLDAGRCLIGQELLAEKKPYLAVLNPELVARVAAAGPAWIVSSYVLSQMPPEDLDEYFDNLVKFMNGGGKAALQMRLAWCTMQYSKTGWYHNSRRMARRLSKRGLVILQIKTRELASKPYKVRGIEARMIVQRAPIPKKQASWKVRAFPGDQRIAGISSFGRGSDGVS